MSKQELERLSADLRKDPALQATFKGVGSDTAAFAQKANEAGYDISVEEMQAAIAARSEAQLNEEELAMVSGGAGDKTVRAEVLAGIDALVDIL